MLSKCFCISSLPFPRSSVFTPFQWFTPHFQNPSQLPRPQLSSITQHWKVRFCRLLWDSSLDHPLPWMSNKQGYSVSHVCKELCKPILRWLPKTLSSLRKALLLQSQLRQWFVQGGPLWEQGHPGIVVIQMNNRIHCNCGRVSARLSELALTVLWHWNRKLSILCRCCFDMGFL